MNEPAILLFGAIVLVAWAALAADDVALRMFSRATARRRRVLDRKGSPLAR